MEKKIVILKNGICLDSVVEFYESKLYKTATIVKENGLPRLASKVVEPIVVIYRNEYLEAYKDGYIYKIDRSYNKVISVNSTNDDGLYFLIERLKKAENCNDVDVNIFRNEKTLDKIEGLDPKLHEVMELLVNIGLWNKRIKVRGRHLSIVTTSKFINTEIVLRTVFGEIVPSINVVAMKELFM